MRKEMIALAATAVIATGCASTGSTPMSSNTAPLPPLGSETTVQVDNHNWSDMVVYAVQNQHRVRLGMVTSLNSREFKLPSSFGVSSADLQIVADPIGGSNTYVTEPIQVQPGQRVELRIENSLRISNWSVW